MIFIKIESTCEMKTMIKMWESAILPMSTCVTCGCYVMHLPRIRSCTTSSSWDLEAIPVDRTGCAQLGLRHCISNSSVWGVIFWMIGVPVCTASPRGRYRIFEGRAPPPIIKRKKTLTCSILIQFPIHQRELLA